MKLENPKEYAFYLLGFKDRSEKALKEKMLNKGFELKEIDTVLDFLREKRYIDDLRLAKSVIKNALENKYWGKYRIKQKLVAEKIKPDYIEKTIEKIDLSQEIPSAEKAKELWVKKNKCVDFKDKQRLMAYLSRRGFSYQIIQEVVSQID